jgi:Cache domain
MDGPDPDGPGGLPPGGADPGTGQGLREAGGGLRQEEPPGEVPGGGFGRQGQFHFNKGQNNDLYIFVYDLEGKVLAHGVRRELVGLNRWTAKDPDGKPWIQDWTKLVKEKGSGWIEYKELNPSQGNKAMKKASYVELSDGMVIGAGIYE